MQRYKAAIGENKPAPKANPATGQPSCITAKSKESYMVTVDRSPELEEFAREGRRRFEAGDTAWFEQTTAYGEVSSFGTAPDEQSRGRDEVLALTMEQVGEMNEAAGLDGFRARRG
jgi:hypothetical protein